MLWSKFEHPVFVLIAVALPFWGGWRVRKHVKTTTIGPPGYLTDIWIGKWPVWSTQRPMLVFDILTLAASAIFAAMIAL